MKVLEVLRALESKGFDPMTPVKPPTLYIDGNPIFYRHHQELRNCLPLGCHLQGGGLIYITK
jgi:hypothetical protein